jgi:hypothetical protein
MWPEIRLAEDGQAMEPEVSSETENGNAPSAAPLADPQDDPQPGPLRYGDMHSPQALADDQAKVPSCIFPIGIEPASISLVIRVDFVVWTLLACAIDPYMVGSSSKI